MKNSLSYIVLTLLILGGSNVMAQKPSISEVIQKDLVQSGSDAAIVKYKNLKKTQPDKYDFSEKELRNLGLGLFHMGQTDDAEKFLKLNTESFPKSSEAYYFLALVEYKSNQMSAALADLDKSISLNKYNTFAQDLTTAIKTPKLYAVFEYTCPACGCSLDGLKFKNPGKCIQCGMVLVKGK